MKAEAPQDYRSAFPTVEEAECLTRFVDALYDNGIMMVHTAMGVLSTVMGDAEIDRLAEAVLSSLRQIKD
jgi:glutamate-1-semialdehyde 2,1-aminomutase